MPKIESYHAKLRKLHAEIGEARTRSCDREVDHNLRDVANAIELYFPEAFSPPVISREMLNSVRRLGERLTGYLLEDSRVLGRGIIALVDDYERRHSVGVEPEQTRGGVEGKERET